MITSNNISIADILKSIDEGRTQLPDFQRGWVWEDNRIRALIASISNGYPIGAAMFLQTGGSEVNFKTRLFEGVDKSKENVNPEKLVLDGQQRTTSIYRSMYSKQPVETCDSKKKPIKRFYYINIPKALSTITDRIDAIISVPENKIIYENIGRDEKLNLSTREKEFEQHYFPINLVFDSSEMMQWQMEYNQYHGCNPVIFQQFKSFFSTIITPMSQYQILVIELGNDVPKEAVCQVFENVNQGGVSLTVFELVTATFAANNFELRKDWDSIWARFKNEKQINYNRYVSFDSSAFLTAVTLLTSYLRSLEDPTKAVSCKKRDVLNLKYEQYITNRDRLLDGLTKAIHFLKEQRIFTAIDMPYTSQLVPLSVAFAVDSNVWFDSTNRKKLEKWFWCGVFGELYGGANETRYATDIQGLFAWVKDDDAMPDTVVRSNFHASRLQNLYTRNSAAYKGVMALVLKNHARDFISNKEMDFVSFVGDATDIHHIFPASYCMKEGIDRARWNSVINKTPICARTNRIIGGYAPSKYLSSIIRNHSAHEDDLKASLASHQVDVDAIFADDFDTYFEKRRNALLDLIEQATGKLVSGRDEFTNITPTQADIDEMEDDDNLYDSVEETDGSENDVEDSPITTIEDNTKQSSEPSKNRRINYTDEVLDFIYTSGKSVYEQGCDPEKFRKQAENLGLSWSSFSRYFLPAFRYMREGTTFKGSLTQATNDYMLNRIYNEYGKDGLRNALKSFVGTIEYYEATGQNKPGDRAIIQRFQQILKNQ